MQIITTSKSGPIVLVGGQNGITVIAAKTPLARLNYFDGKFLRASDLNAEQRYLRSLVEQSNRAGGHGVAHGFNVTDESGGLLGIGDGLAIDAEGRVLLLTAPVTVSLADLIEKSRQAIPIKKGVKVSGPAEFGDCVIASETPPATAFDSGDLFVITIAHAEALCGEEDVYGKLCEEACITSTDRPYRIEGIIIRARPLQLLLPLPVSAAVALNQGHLRSRVASSYFESERRRIACHISKNGLESEMWCLGALAATNGEVPIAVAGRGGAGILFLDPWIVRRERIDPEARRYWQWRTCMRPWDVFLAQVLQFQCQLRDCFKHGKTGKADDPCKDEKHLIRAAADKMAEVTNFYGIIAAKLASLEGATLLPGGQADLKAITQKLLDVRFQLPPQDRLLIRCGIIELPSAGYLPVVPGSVVPVNRQIRQMMGEGVDLRFCIVRPDFVAHALEEAQHMERISLIEGLDHPEAKAQVDILVPNGQMLEQKSRSLGRGFEALVQFGIRRSDDVAAITRLAQAAVQLQGAARTTAIETGGGALYLAAVTQTEKIERVVGLVSGLAGIAKATDANFKKLQKLAEETEPAPVGTIASNPMLFTHLNTIAAEALRFNASRRAELLSLSAAAEPGTVFTPTQPAQGRIAAMWLRANVAQNPFALSAGETTSFELRLVLVMPATETTTFDLDVRGECRMDQPVITSGGRKISGSGSCLIALERSEEGQAQPAVNASAKFKVQAFLNSPATALDAEFEVIAEKSITRVKVKSELTGAPVHVRTQVTYELQRADKPGQAIDLADSLLIENVAVLENGNPSHTAAISALQVIGAALDDAGFADTNGRLLFPPPPPPTDELLVRATLDWILFHRRRIKTCTSIKEPVLPAMRRYQVYHALAPDLRQVKQLAVALLNNDTEFLSQAGFRPVGIVEFGASAASLLTPPADVQADWKLVQPGAALILGVIGTTGIAQQDGTTLALARIAAFEQAVAPITPPHPQLKNEPLPTIPAPLATPATDGSIILVTLEGPKFTCHTVLRAKSPINQDFVVILKNEGLAGLLQRDFISKLEEVQFDAGTDKIRSGDVEKIKGAWAAQGGGQLAASLLVFQKGDASVPANLRTNQLKAITVAATGNAGPPSLQPAEVDELTTACTTVTILEAAPADVVRNALLIYGNWDRMGGGAGQHFLNEESPVSKTTFVNNTPQGNVLKDFINGLTANQPVLGVTLATTKAVPDADAQTRLKSVIDALIEAQRPAPAPSRQTVESLNEHDRKQVETIDQTPNDFDEVIFFELNAGA